MTLTRQSDEAQHTDDAPILVLVNLVISAVLLVGALLGFIFVSSAALIGLVFLTLLNGGYWLRGLERTRAAHAQDEAEKAKHAEKMLAEMNAAAKGRQSQSTALFPKMWGARSSQPAKPTDTADHPPPSLTAKEPWWVRAQGPNGPSGKK